MNHAQDIARHILRPDALGEIQTFLASWPERSKTLENHCWMWTGVCVPDRPAFKVKGSYRSVPRLLAAMASGWMAPSAICLFRTCPHILCVNPYHFEVRSRSGCPHQWATLAPVPEHDPNSKISQEVAEVVEVMRERDFEKWEHVVNDKYFMTVFTDRGQVEAAWEFYKEKYL